ncbi:MAG TPA: chemotaxis protein CheW [Bacteroidales bacterium]|nr:chemotaxis protein CheW [Bacteroidales bacterium]
MKTNVHTGFSSYLTFILDTELFAIDVTKVISVLEVGKITKIPDAPRYMPGVINLRGEVLPIIDTRIKFGMSAIEYNQDTCIIVLNLNIEGTVIKLGAVVDRVIEVHEINNNLIKSVPQHAHSAYIVGMIEKEDEFILLPDVDKIFSVDEIVAITSAETVNAARQENKTAFNETKSNEMTEAEFLDREFPTDATSENDSTI